ncbi:MAG: ATP-binding cassette domain-containing protein, partial [Clostridia bacterium]|nr:ATP-binding cassette domain-containing protein [Clostridia bacterium]
MPIVIERLTHTYMPNSPFQSTAIHGVDLTIGDGDFFGLIGHTGSGKTTLAMHMNGLLAPTEGRVLVDGRDIGEKGYNKRDVRRRVGLVFQYPEHQLFEESVALDIAFGPKNLGLARAEVDERVAEALHRVGLPEEIGGRSPFDLSGGQ